MRELEGYILVMIGVKKIIEVIDHPKKRQADRRWADQEEEEHE
jgi:chloramphenicol 3-O-phosphotransferase